MAVKIKLMRMGKIRSPQYRIVVADARTKREGRAIETIGRYHPKENPSLIEVDSERAAYWLGVGAQPTEPVRAILEKSGDWQRFHGLPEPPPLLRPEPKADKRAAFDEVARQSLTPDKSATTAKKRPESAPAATEPVAASEQTGATEQ